jgi:hypothetical protein
MLKKVKVKDLKRSHKWCLTGHRSAKLFLSYIGKPDEIDAFDIVRALKAVTDTDEVTYRDHYKAIDAILLLLDEETVEELQDRFKTIEPLRDFLRSGIPEWEQIDVLYEVLESKVEIE